MERDLLTKGEFDPVDLIEKMPCAQLASREGENPLRLAAKIN